MNTSQREAFLKGLGFEVDRDVRAHETQVSRWVHPATNMRVPASCMVFDTPGEFLQQFARHHHDKGRLEAIDRMRRALR